MTRKERELTEMHGDIRRFLAQMKVFRDRTGPYLDRVTIGYHENAIIYLNLLKARIDYALETKDTYNLFADLEDLSDRLLRSQRVLFNRIERNIKIHGSKD